MVRLARSQRGFVLIAVTLSVVALLGVAGLAVDVGRMYIAKSEAQSFCDAAALAAAVKLDGKSAGITAATAAVADSLRLPWNFGSNKIATAEVDFATSLGNSWTANPGSPSGYTHARVRATMPVSLYFFGAVVNANQGTVATSAVAAQVPITRFERGLGPFTAVSTNTTSPTLGLVVGEQYSIQWPQYNGTRTGCNANNPERCFNSAPCSGDPNSSLFAVAQYWGANINGYWGSNQNSEIAAEVLDLIQLHPIAIGDLIFLSNGNKNVEAQILDRRVNQDWDLIDNTVPAYLANPNRNGRRLIAVPITNPTPTGTYVTGYGSFLLLSDGSAPSSYYSRGSGNDPFCALYVGPFVQGGISSGASSEAGAFRVSLVQ